MKNQMLHHLKKLKAFCLDNKIFTAFLLVQAVVLAAMLLSAFLPKVVYTVPLDSFVENGHSDAIAITEEGLMVANSIWITDTEMLQSQPFALAKGAYKVYVSYQSVYDVTSINDVAGDINLYSLALYHQNTKTQSRVIEKNLVLLFRESSQTAEGRIWVDGQEGEDIFELYYDGIGYNNITEIVVEEQVIWRWVQLFAACLVLGVLDLLYLLFFAKMQASPCPLRENAAAKAKTILLLCAITFVASIPYFVEYTYYTHDVSFHLARITSLAAELGSGQFPVRMMTTMNNGYGYASALFYCDLFLYLPAILYNCMLPLQAAYHIYIICINCATCAICYYAFGKMTQSRSIGMMSALLYTLAAYRLTNVYTRAAVGEYTAMTFFPLVVLGLWGIYQSKKPRYQDWLPLSLGMAGIIQSHVLSVEMVVIFLGLLCLLLCKQTLQCARIKSFVLAAGLCMGLTAWFWVPFLQSYLQMDLLATEIMLEQTQSGGILLSQLLALSGYVQGNGYLAMPLMLGWALLAGGLLAAFYMLQRSRLALAVKPQYQAMCLAVGLGTLAAIFTLDVFPWTQIAYSTHDLVVKAVNSIQFPWRYLAIATLCFVVATAFALLLVKQHHPQYYRALCGVLVALTLCTTGLFYTDFVNNTETDPKYTIDSYDLVINWGEYMMEGSIPDAQYTNAVQTSDDALIITSYDKTNGVATAVYQNTSDAPQTVSLPIYNYPYYQATDAATGAAYAITNGENNRIEITVAAGSSGTITVQYVPPMLWHLAEFVSAASLLFVVGMAFYQRKKQKRTIPAEAATA